MEFKFDTEVTDLKKSGDIWEVHTNQGVFETKYVVNAAGVYADKFHNMVSEKKSILRQDAVITACLTRVPEAM